MKKKKKKKSRKRPSCPFILYKASREENRGKQKYENGLQEGMSC